MTPRTFIRIPAFVYVFALAEAIAAQIVDIPVRNWTVPPFRAAGLSGGLSPMIDLSPAVGFTAITPCRVVDTRNPAGPYGGPALAANVARTFDIDNGPCTGIPTGVVAYSLSIGAILAPADGFLTAWPTGSAFPVVSQINMTAGEVVANAAIVPAGTGGAIDVLLNVGPTNVYIDINGYFTDDQNPGQSLTARSSTVSPAILGENTSTDVGAIGVLGQISSPSAGGNSAAVRGMNLGTGTQGIGVLGSHAGSGWGVYGFASGTSVGAVGVRGLAFGTSGNVFGVKGITNSESATAAGVKGVSGEGDPLGDAVNCSSCRNAGVLGVDASTSSTGGGAGVLGVSRSMAIRAVLLQTSGTTQQVGAYLGLRSNISPFLWAVFGEGDLGASGTKSFVEPHPTDPSKTIRYISLEGPEAGTYFRGRGRFERGLATIEVPEDFRLVTDSEGLSIQVTPIGEMATVAVLRVGLDRIIVRGSRDVEFFYTVNGVRRTFKDVRPISEGSSFAPHSADARIPAFLSEGQKQLLIQNGTYNADGTVNMETARRLGWDREWENRSRPAPRSPDLQP